MTSIQIEVKDGLSSSTAFKGPCRVATTANITLSGQQTIDGVAVVTDDRVLVKNQTNAFENGIYVADTGVWRRSKDFNKNRDVKTGTTVNVTSGTVGAGWWEVTTADPISIGLTNLTFARSAIEANPADGSVTDVMIANPSRLYNRINQITFVEDLGASPSASGAVNTAAIEAAQQEIIGKFGSGKLVFGHGTYMLDALNTTEIFDNDGTPIAGNLACVVQRPGISFEGQGRRATTLKANSNGTLNLIFPVSPLGQYIRDLGLDGSWNGVNGAGHGIVQFTPSDYLLPNLIINGDFSDGTTTGWTQVGTGTLSVVAGRMRVTRDGAGNASRASQAFTTVVGRNYRVTVTGYVGTSANGRWSAAASSTGSTSDIIGSFYDLTDGIPRFFNFTATTTTTYVLLFNDGAVGDANAYTEWDNIKVSDFPLADQKLYCRDYTIERLYIHDVASYGTGISCGDIEGLWYKDNWLYNTGADGLDIKGRGPSGGLQPALNIMNNYIRKFGQRVTLPGQAGIDIRGQAVVIGNHVAVEEKVAEEVLNRVGIRARPPAVVAGSLTSEVFGGASTRIIGNIIESFEVTKEGHDGIDLSADDVIVANNKLSGLRYGIMATRSTLYDTNSNNQKIQGNIVRDSIVAYRAIAGTGYVNFDANTDVDCGEGYRLEGDNAFVTNMQSISAANPIRTIAGATNNTFQGGKVGGTITTKINDAGTGTKISGIQGVATKNRIVSPAQAVDVLAGLVVDIPMGLDVVPSADDALVTVQCSDSAWRGFAEVISISGTNLRTRLVTTTVGAGGATAKVVADVNTERL